MASTKILIVSILASLALVIAVYGEQNGFKTVSVNQDFSNLTIYVPQYQLPWAQALTACNNLNANLLVVDSPEKDKLLVDLFIKGGSNITLPGSNSWIAATEYREGVWVWGTTYDPLYYTRWFVGQPDDTSSLNCVYQAVGNYLYWRDANCSASMYFLCESQS